MASSTDHQYNIHLANFHLELGQITTLLHVTFTRNAIEPATKILLETKITNCLSQLQALWQKIESDANLSSAEKKVLESQIQPVSHELTRIFNEYLLPMILLSTEK